MEPSPPDPRTNLLYNDTVLGILRAAMTQLEAIGMSCALVPGAARPREDDAMPVSLFVAPTPDVLLDLRAAETLASDVAMSTTGEQRFEHLREFLRGQDAAAAGSAAELAASRTREL